MNHNYNGIFNFKYTHESSSAWCLGVTAVVLAHAWMDIQSVHDDTAKSIEASTADACNNSLKETKFQPSYSFLDTTSSRT